MTDLTMASGWTADQGPEALERWLDEDATGLRRAVVEAVEAEERMSAPVICTVVSERHGYEALYGADGVLLGDSFGEVLPDDYRSLGCDAVTHREMRVALVRQHAGDEEGDLVWPEQLDEAHLVPLRKEG